MNPSANYIGINGNKMIVAPVAVNNGAVATKSIDTRRNRGKLICMATVLPIPPRLDQPEPESAPTGGRLGLGLSLVAPVTIILMVLLHPG
jgi:hypothetical protein